MSVGMKRKAAVALVILTVSAEAVDAHEFWIATEVDRAADSATIKADLKVGQMFKGESYPYLSERFVTFTDTIRGETHVLSGQEGDIPAISLKTQANGLHVIAHQTVAFRVTYDDWAKFERYLTDEGLDGIAETHRARGLPETGFAERYIRCAKALVQIGPVGADDQDVRTGMPLELVAQDNPFASDTEAIEVQLFWRGMPAANRQVSIFHDAGAVARTTTITDADGRALIPLATPGKYMLSAVFLEPYDSPPVVWQSHWASLSFDLAGGN
jgi:uncharacterized GH25 family protein